MKRFSIKSLYLYGISAVTLIIAIIGVVGLLNSVIALLMPPIFPAKSPDNSVSPLSDYTRSEVLDITRNLIQVIVAVPIYIYHWRQARILDEQ